MNILRGGGIAEGIAIEKGLALVRTGVRVAEAEGRRVGEISSEAASAHNLATVDGVSTAGEGLHLPSRFEGYGWFVIWIAQAKRRETGEEAEELSPTCGWILLGNPHIASRIDIRRGSSRKIKEKGWKFAIPSVSLPTSRILPLSGISPLICFPKCRSSNCKI